MKKTISIALAAVLTVVMACSLASGCSSSAKSADYMSGEGAYATEAVYDDYGFTQNTASDSVKEMPDEIPEANESEFERKIIRDADVYMTADDADACYKSLLAKAKELGGYEANSYRRSNDNGSYRYIDISATIKVPSEKLDTFLAFLGDAGTVESQSVSSNEITAEYYDVKTRLESKRAALERYLEMLEQASTIAEMISIQNQIDYLTEDIEAYEGRLKLYDSQTSESRVSLDIHQKVEMTATDEDFEWDSLEGGEILKLIANGFMSVLNFLWSALVWIVIIGISASPIIIIVVGVIHVIKRYRKKHPKKPKAVQPYMPGVTAYVQPQPVPVQQKPAAAPATETEPKKDEKK